MRIKDVEVSTLSLPVAGRQRNARRVWVEKPLLFCFVTLEDGRIGVGEGWTSYASPRALAATIEEDVAPHVIGRDLDAVRDLAETIRDACVMSGRYGILAVGLSAVEMALWDLRAQLSGEPLWRLLGGRSGTVPVYASGGLYGPDKSPERLGEELSGYVAQGHRTVKLKVGGVGLTDDVARIAAARSAIGPDIGLCVDAHYTMSEDTALTFAQAIAPQDVGWLEAPILPTDYDGYARLAAASPVPLCGNETLPWRDGFARLAKAGVRYLMPDVSACGGIAETIAIGDLAVRSGGRLTLHSSSSIVLLLASLHVAAAHPAAHSVEFHMMHRWFHDLADPELLMVSDGTVSLGQAPGLGLDASRLRNALSA